MAVTKTSRLGITRWSSDDDDFIREQMDADHAALEALVAIDGSGVLAARPAAAKPGFYYYATDAQTLYRDNGTGWDELGSVRRTGGSVITSSGTGVRTLALKMALGQTARVFEVIDSADSSRLFIDTTGTLSTLGDVKGIRSGFFGGPAATGVADQSAGLQCSPRADSPASRALVVRGAAGQTASIMEILLSSGDIAHRVVSDGRVHMPLGGYVGDLVTGPLLSVRVPTTKGASVALQVQGTVGQTGNLLEVRDGAAALTLHVKPDGTSVADRLRVTAADTSVMTSQASVESSGPTVTPLAVRGAAGQSVNLLEVQSAAGAVHVKVDSAGRLYEGTGRVYSPANPQPTPYAIITRAASQVADVTERVVNFTTEEDDPFGLFDSSEPSRLTIPFGQGGLWHFHYVCQNLIDPNTGHGFIQIRKRSVSGWRLPQASTSATVGGVAVMEYVMTQGDWVDVTLYSPTGSLPIQHRLTARKVA